MSQMMSKHPPRFITFEGGEGAGKTSLINRLEKALKSQGVSVLRTREPGGTPFGEQIRAWLLTNSTTFSIGAKAELLLFLAARAQHIEEVIEPALKAGKVVLCDRFNDSTIAYQGAGRGLGFAWVKQMCDMVCGKIMPDLTFFLDVAPDIGLSRTRKATKENAAAGEVDRIEAEHLDFHQRVREAFLAIGNQDPHRFHRIDANQSLETVANSALQVLTSLDNS